VETKISQTKEQEDASVDPSGESRSRPDCVVDSHQYLEHKMEQNNYRMRGSESDWRHGVRL
jgi:hypothetical protein